MFTRSPSACAIARLRTPAETTTPSKASSRAVRSDPHPAVDRRDAVHLGAEAQVGAAAGAGPREADGELVDVARAVALGQEAADEVAVQRRLDLADLGRRQLAAHEAALRPAGR